MSNTLALVDSFRPNKHYRIQGDYMKLSIGVAVQSFLNRNLEVQSMYLEGTILKDEARSNIFRAVQALENVPINTQTDLLNDALKSLIILEALLND